MSSTSARKKQKKMSSFPESSTSAKTTTIATRILLDKARDGSENGNFVCSPLSIETLLGMLAAGAEGKTLEQLLEFLGHETIDQLLYESPSSKLLENQGRGGKGLDICLANGIWVNKEKINRVKSCYKEVLKSVYKTKARFVDFNNNEAASKINSWVNEKTRGLIPRIIDGGAFKGDEVIALVNALYFKGLWSDKPFYANNTRKEDFHLLNGKTVSVPFMTSKQEFYYGAFEGYKILELPYESESRSNKFSMYMDNPYEREESSKFSMYIFLPDRKDGLQELLEVFHSDPALFHEYFCLTPRVMEKLLIPKFKISYTFDVGNVVKQMGLTLPFERTNMEFSRMVEPSVPGDNVYVSNVLQKCFIEIDEKGTEAAAVTYMNMEMGGFRRPPPPPPPVQFVADHPFMFIIREDTSRAVLFMGVVLMPQQDI